MTRTKKRARPLSRLYKILKRSARAKGFRWYHTTTQKRAAVRYSHRLLRKTGIGAAVEVTTAEGALIYQAHLTSHGKIVAEEL